MLEVAIGIVIGMVFYPVLKALLARLLRSVK